MDQKRTQNGSKMGPNLDHLFRNIGALVQAKRLFSIKLYVFFKS